ncbi:hypothetical protein BGP77_17630 [Saccharospirillum sp. MSK14-1]|uniref:imm11 family protein n=1 Tax=Saccharospirillum sp. MSK14-1 TaxID=1897632 RepID=UPI000D341D1D|nr:DUF1629 domain-containing protein [Saccharospirillum sp. MSK14-1]PTY38260.1 hypothetical protein BGP77_17630 [Saccharospirillum sp. MSK14-1]
MSKYNDQYYIVFNRYNKDTLYLTTHARTGRRDGVGSERLVGNKPYFLCNAYREKDTQEGIRRPVQQAHLYDTYPVVVNDVRESIRWVENDQLQFYPAVIIDDDDKWLENYWIMNVHAAIDCLDLEACDIDDEEDDELCNSIDRYSFDDAKLDAIPEPQRWVIKVKGGDVDYVFFHEKVVEQFNSAGVNTLRFIKVSDWEMGVQFQ